MLDFGNKALMLAEFYLYFSCVLCVHNSDEKILQIRWPHSDLFILYTFNFLVLQLKKPLNLSLEGILTYTTKSTNGHLLSWILAYSLW